MRDAEPDMRQDPDVNHLRELLTLLRPLSHTEFWEPFARRNQNLEGKLGYHLRAFVTGDPDDLALLCRGLLLYFSNSDHEMWLHLNDGLLDLDPNDYNEPGRYLAEDICATAWKLYVRYKPRFHDSLVGRPPPTAS
jgi:hypothetical protein